jgi:UDP-N-acetylmuramoyl-tripeptide--D-alanyl-D-alanine ligase
MKRTLQAFATAMQGELVGDDCVFGQVSTDSRTVSSGQMFIALSGPNFDAHDFVSVAAERGAVGAVVSRHLPISIPQIVVGDTLVALQLAGAAWRAQFSIPVIAVAGSNGKTTTKEMIASILGQLGPCHATPGTLNNHIGVPLTLLALEVSHATAVIEIGANHPGEVAALTALVKPTIGLVTNAGAEHLEGFGDLEGVAHAEGELFVGLGPEATAIINADDPYAGLWASMVGARAVAFFGKDMAANVRLLGAVRTLSASVQEFECDTPKGLISIRLSLAGHHNVINALGAVSAALVAGASIDHVATGLATMRPVKGRLDVKTGSSGACVIDDSYNANPSSFNAALTVLERQPTEKWLVLGAMGELGETGHEAHREAGRAARSAGVQRLFGIGALARDAVDAFGDQSEWFATADALIERLHGQLHPGLTVLVKGSRFNRLERVVEALCADGASLQHASDRR